MSIEALTLDATGQVVKWGGDEGEDRVTFPAPVGHTFHADILEASLAVINTRETGLKYTKVVASAFVAMTEAERLVVDEVTVTSGVQRTKPRTFTATGSSPAESIYSVPLKIRPVAGGEYELTTRFHMRCDTKPSYTADGPTNAARAVLVINGTISDTWLGVLDQDSSFSSIVSAPLVEGSSPTVDFLVDRMGADEPVTVTNVVITLKRISGDVHEVE